MTRNRSFVFQDTLFDEATVASFIFRFQIWILELMELSDIFTRGGSVPTFQNKGTLQSDPPFL
jgi:hypothetical protein